MLAIQAAKKSGHYFSMNRENFVQLESGAVVAFEEYGDPNGVPVIFCHGWPSSRTMARLTDEPARDLGIRIISPDRPGISRSSLQPNRKLADWPRVIERVLDHVGIGEFRALAISGGARSEEHTSELQSQSNLVCRLLLEKKNTTPPALVAASGRCMHYSPQTPTKCIPSSSTLSLDRHPSSLPHITTHTSPNPILTLNSSI